jgi:hypothetical protein
MGDWVRDKTISWKTWRTLLQTNTGVFPFEDRLQKWVKHPDGICELCKRYREMGLKLLGGKPDRDTTGHLQNSVCLLQTPSATGTHNTSFQQVQYDMSKTRSVNKDWEFVSKGTETLTKRTGRGSSADWGIPSSTSMRSFLGAIGGTPLGPLVVYFSCWGKTYRSVSLSSPREARDEGSLQQRGDSRC